MEKGAQGQVHRRLRRLRPGTCFRAKSDRRRRGTGHRVLEVGAGCRCMRHGAGCPVVEAIVA